MALDVLVLDEWIPSSCDSGKSIRSFELLTPLAGKHRITYLVNQDDSGQEENIRKMESAGFEVRCIPRPKVYGSIAAVVSGAVFALIDRFPISVRRHFSRDFVTAVQEIIREKSFDLVHTEWSHYALYGRYANDLPQFVCTHNVEYLSWERFAKNSRNPFRKLLGFHEAWKMRRYEKEFYRRVDYLSVVSEDDARLLREKFGLERYCIIPNGVSIASYDSVPNTPKRNRLVYCGSMDAFVNQEAVAWFLREIFPLILREKPDATFTVIGRRPPKSLLRFQNERIRFTGRIDDVRVPLKEAMIDVVPLRTGGGSRLKILEAFAARIPVVSTTVGAEGLEVENRKHLVLADSPKDFAYACVHLLDDHDQAAGLVDHGRALVDEKYDWSRISPLVEEAWQTTIDLSRHRRKGRAV